MLADLVIFFSGWSNNCPYKDEFLGPTNRLWGIHISCSESWSEQVETIEMKPCTHEVTNSIPFMWAFPLEFLRFREAHSASNPSVTAFRILVSLSFLKASNSSFLWYSQVLLYFLQKKKECIEIMNRWAKHRWNCDFFCFLVVPSDFSPEIERTE